MLLWLFFPSWQFPRFYLCVSSFNVKSLTSVAQWFTKINNVLLQISQVASPELFLIIALSLKSLSKILTLLNEYLCFSGLSTCVCMCVCVDKVRVLERDTPKEGHPSHFLADPLFPQFFIQTSIQSLIMSRNNIIICMWSCPLHCSVQFCIPRTWNRGRNSESILKMFDKGINFKLGPMRAPWLLFYGKKILKLNLQMLQWACRIAWRNFKLVCYVMWIYSPYQVLRNTKLKTILLWLADSRCKILFSIDPYFIPKLSKTREIPG